MNAHQRDELISALNELDYDQVLYWLLENFTPDGYRNQDTCVEAACNLSFAKYGGDASTIAAFIYSLWAMHGELPEVIYQFDSYGRLATYIPNWSKPGVRERINEMVDAITPSYQELYRKGRA